MKFLCKTCRMVSADNNLWCQSVECPAGQLTGILSAGEWLNDIEILERQQITHMATTYIARRNKHKVLVKVAHARFEEHLVAEALFLLALRKWNTHSAWPHLQPALAFTTSRQSPYARVTRNKVSLLYTVFRYQHGESLHQYLKRNSTPWSQHSLWFIIQLAQLIGHLHERFNRLHLAVTPETIFVRVDRRGIPRPLLSDIGLLLEMDTSVARREFYRHAFHTSYTAPELGLRASSYPPDARSDIYSIGMLLREMLGSTSKPEQSFGTGLNVLEDRDADIVKATERATNLDPEKRPANLRLFATELRHQFGAVPPEQFLFPLAK